MKIIKAIPAIKINFNARFFKMAFKQGSVN